MISTIVLLSAMSRMRNLSTIYLETSHVPTKNTNSTKEKGPTLFAFPKNVTRYHQLEQISLKNLHVPRNLHILFVGDSVTRYQYISLAYFLKFGTWINTKHPIPMIANNASLDDMYQQPSAKEHVPHMGLIWKNFWDSKGDWSNYSNTMLNPFEKCDCIESNVKQWQRRFGVDEVENRYFRDHSRNNSLLYMKKLGDWNNYKIPLPFLSTWNIHEMNSIHNESTQAKIMSLNKTNIPISDYGLHTNNWTQFIQDFVVNLDPKPNVFVFNQGLWPHEQFQQPHVYKELVNAISMAGMTSIYKTTSKWSDDDGSENESYEKEICKLTDFCIDLSWTLLVPKYLYADRAHFYEPVYSWMNLQLLSLIVPNTS